MKFHSHEVFTKEKKKLQNLLQTLDNMMIRVILASRSTNFIFGVSLFILKR